MSLADLIHRDAPLEAIAQHLDGLDHAARVQAIRAVNGKGQRQLWAATEVAGAVGLADLVPLDQPPLQPVRHFGKNSLPLFSHFEKRFCRPTLRHPTLGAQSLWGYNHQPNAWLTGPGYFICGPSPDPERGAVVIDYHHTPPPEAARPAGWPSVRGNARGLGRLVYGFMQDYLRTVSRHVTVGRAWRHGEATDNYFLLSREP